MKTRLADLWMSFAVLGAGALVLLLARKVFGATTPALPGSPASTTPAGPAPPVPQTWARFAGARPEPRGWPENTILAVPGLEKVSPAARRALLDLCAALDLPVDSIAAVIASESGWNPSMPNGIRFDKSGKPLRGPDGAYLLAQNNLDRIKEGKKPFYAVGLVQLTIGANLPGFLNAEDLLKVLDMPAEEQIEKVIRPMYERMSGAVKGADPAKIYMLNFLPSDAGKPADFALGERDAADKWRAAVFKQNQGFDSNGDGRVTVQEVTEAAARQCRAAKGRRIAVDGSIIENTTEQAPKPSTAPPAPASPSKLVAPTNSPASPSSPASSTSAPAVVPGRAGHMLIEAVRTGTIDAPEWVDVPWAEAGVVLRVSADALRAPVDGKLLRLPVSWAETLEITRRLNCIPLTAEVSDLIYAAATVKLQVRSTLTWSTPAEVAESSRKMGALDFVQAFNRDLDGQIAGRTGLAADLGKDWILSQRLLLGPRLGVTYGWRYSSSRMVQDAGPDTKFPAHDDAHYDYSQVLRLVQRNAADGTDLLNVYEARGMKPAVLQLFARAQ